MDSLPAWIASCLDERYSHEFDFRGVDVVRLPKPEHLPEVREAIERHEAAMRCASAEQLKPALAKLRMLTKSAGESEQQGAMRAAAYLEMLQQWPADVALHVLATQASQSTFWPSWAELEDRLGFYAQRRKARLGALVRMVQQMEVRDD